MFEICGDSVLIFLIDLFSNLLVLDVRINLYVALLFLFFWCRMLFNNENMFVEIICIGDRFVVAFVFFPALMFDYLMLFRDVWVCFGQQITRIFYFVLIYVETRVGMTTAIRCWCFNVIHVFLFAFRRAMS